MKLSNAKFIGFDKDGKAYFKLGDREISCEEKIVEKSGIIPELLEDEEIIQLQFGVDGEEILGMKRLSNNNFYIELYKKKHYRQYKKRFEPKKEEDREFKLENKHLKGFPKPQFKGAYEKLFPALSKRQLASASLLCTEPVVLKLTPAWHLAVGLGITSLFETSINLNPVYGCPSIPSSSVKGAVRSHAIATYFDDEAHALKDSVFCDLFGCPKAIEKNGDPSRSFYEKEKKGNLIFFDAFPIPEKKKKVQIAVDILNPHYPDYYSEKTLAPADWQQPIPVNFFVVKNTPFQFIVGLRKGADNEETIFGDEILTPLDIAKKLLKETLTNQGIGAKTAVGYGFMKE